jgi:hypothetical protein
MIIKKIGGWGGIRTHETLARLPVFKTGAFNHSATHPHDISGRRSFYRCLPGLKSTVYMFLSRYFHPIVQERPREVAIGLYWLLLKL